MLTPGIRTCLCPSLTQAPEGQEEHYPSQSRTCARASAHQHARDVPKNVIWTRHITRSARHVLIDEAFQFRLTSLAWLLQVVSGVNQHIPSIDRYLKRF